VTQISRTATYPATGDGEGDGAFSGDRRVAHWGLPLELALVAGRKPEANEYPCLLFQVSSYDRWDRYRCEGYGRLALGGLRVRASETAVKTWRAGGTILDRLRAHYVGGSPEIGDLAYVGVPRDAKGQKVHSRLGFVADASGEIKIRAHVATQRRRGRSKAAASGVGKLKAGLFSFGKRGGDPNDYDSNQAIRPGATGEPTGDPSALDDLDAAPRTEREVEDVVARARARVAEARSRERDFGRAAAAADFARPGFARGQGQVPPAAASEPDDVLARARQRHARAQPPDQENERPPDDNPAATGAGAGAGGWGLGADPVEGGAATKAQEPAPGGWGLGAESLS
jgi:Meckel syndrome type 1 protein